MVSPPAPEEPTQQNRRDVQWNSVVGPLARPPISTPSSSDVSVLGAADELMAYQDLDTVLRRAVEILRGSIGFERVGIFLEDAARATMLGTFGTGATRETTDERRISYPRSRFDVEVHTRAAEGHGHWLVLKGAPHIVHLATESRVLGYGWVAMTPIRSCRGRVGLLFNDTALTHAPLDPVKQQRAAIFCSLLGNIIESKRDALVRDRLPVERRSSEAVRLPRFRRDVPDVLGPVANITSTNPLVCRILEVLRLESTLTGGQLASRFGISDGHLARVFKSETGVSLVQFRNRIRLQRFFRIINEGGESLLEAALRAGFGSYAQFHRVFRGELGTTPSAFLTVNGGEPPVKVAEQAAS